MATRVTYLRALPQAGLSLADAARTLSFTVAVGTDFFGGIAKLRAPRLMWRRVLEVSGAADPPICINAMAAEHVLSRVDPWVNLLRTTVASFAAGVGGADSVICLPFDHCLGGPDEFSRRFVARRWRGARATFARNFFEAGGVKALGNDGFSGASEAARAFTDSGARVAVICGSDAQYTELAVAVASALKGNGATRVYLAGRPSDRAEDFAAGGIDDYIFIGANVLAVCSAVLDGLGVAP